MYYLLIALFLIIVIVTPYVVALTFIGSSIVGLGVGVVEYVTAALAGFTPRAPIGHLRIDPPEPSRDGPDPAFRSYYAGPVLWDYLNILRTAITRMWAKILSAPTTPTPVSSPLVRRAWLWASNTEWPRWFAYPVAAGITAGLVGGGACAIGLVAFASLVFLLLLLVLVASALLMASGSWVVEYVVLFLRGITIECPSCHEKVTRPVYRCPAPECGAAHRSLVPGTTGVLRRTCACHTTLPTLLALGKSRLRAQCARCGFELPTKGLTAPTVHIPVIAGPKAGKSVFIQSAVSRLMLRGDGFEFADERAKESFERNIELGVHQDPSRALKTAVVNPRAHTVFVGAEGSRARRLLYLYDPAGERVESVDHLADAQFLAFTKGVVFIVDPFSLRQVRSGTPRAVLGRVSASNTAPKEVLERFVEALAERGFSWRGSRISIPVAVVLTKCDGLLDPSGPSHPYAARSASSREERALAIRSWLTGMGQHELLSSLDNHFAKVSYFAVSIQDSVEVRRHGAVINDDPATPLLWLLNGKVPA
ncbi:TRAFAC clade GTPase domain-containing protein [Goodfellowiella coeruleoviolacea]|uniref:Double-GTPase 2 domain-containing protein n=1 Tax=Goodfellowiella coeruleoviolacea TaxID=334858 RepID=A0AAE3GGU6_9PSEU|nr:hypothetical protein [Goodfellowiella coeruleoviolacea]MCP2167109.1 hypothetical protein [Goodfellowiella coeruleoviolacea]